MDRATRRIPSVQRALRAAQDLEPLHIEEASKDAGRPLEVDAVEMRGDWTFGAYVVNQKADTAQRHIGCAIRLRHLQVRNAGGERIRSEEHTSELQSLMRISYAVFGL